MVPTGMLKDKVRAVGTWYYMAPELLGHKPFDGKCEVYSIGLILNFI